MAFYFIGSFGFGTIPILEDFVLQSAGKRNNTVLFTVLRKKCCSFFQIIIQHLILHLTKITLNNLIGLLWIHGGSTIFHDLLKGFYK
ncbi:hypothetical protein SDC9_203934 [bioreactor metagenome]|uniref:Uncharacterized protein n=1 Tax=bioreactor metagenome TaxID=1076179 RepID=A0A645IXW0_9ZZZZ